MNNINVNAAEPTDYFDGDTLTTLEIKSCPDAADISGLTEKYASVEPVNCQDANEQFVKDANELHPMNYGRVRKEYETRVRDQVNSQLPGFGRLCLWNQPSCNYDSEEHGKLCDAAQAEVEDAIKCKDSGNPFNCMTAFAEYLWKERNVPVWDCEFLCLLGIAMMRGIYLDEPEFDSIQRAIEMELAEKAKEGIVVSEEDGNG